MIAEEPGSIPDLSMYLPLIDSFLLRTISENTFTLRYMRAFQRDSRLLDDQWYEILNDIFLDSDEYVDDPRLRRGGKFQIDEHQLRDRVHVNRQRLRDLGVD